LLGNEQDRVIWNLRQELLHRQPTPRRATSILATVDKIRAEQFAEFAKDYERNLAERGAWQARLHELDPNRWPKYLPVDDEICPSAAFTAGWSRKKVPDMADELGPLPEIVSPLAGLEQGEDEIIRNAYRPARGTGDRVVGAVIGAAFGAWIRNRQGSGVP